MLQLQKKGRAISREKYDQIVTHIYLNQFVCNHKSWIGLSNSYPFLGDEKVYVTTII